MTHIAGSMPIDKTTEYVNMTHPLIQLFNKKVRYRKLYRTLSFYNYSFLILQLIGKFDHL